MFEHLCVSAHEVSLISGYVVVATYEISSLSKFIYVCMIVGRMSIVCTYHVVSKAPFISHIVVHKEQLVCATLKYVPVDRVIVLNTNFCVSQQFCAMPKTDRQFVVGQLLRAQDILSHPFRFIDNWAVFRTQYP